MKATALAFISIALIACTRERAEPIAVPPQSIADSTPDPVQEAPIRTFVEEPIVGINFYQDNEESREVYNFIHTRHPKRPGVTTYHAGGSHSTHITVYGVTNAADQDSIVESLRAEFPKRHWKQIYLLFLERERFVERADGWKERDGERALYSTLITNP